MLRIQRGLLGSCTRLSRIPHFEKFLLLPVLSSVSFLSPRSDPVHRQFVLSPRHRPTADWLSIEKISMFHSSTRSHCSSAKLYVYVVGSGCRPAWLSRRFRIASSIIATNSVFVSALLPSLASHWSGNGPQLTCFHPDADLSVQRGASRKLAKSNKL